ncbi:phosphoadenosine phosphosulfate reductase family protein [Thomasclavelia cocleata]|uniref:phosphoadenosine phosphosulfate reductase family protein n=1 Tax=Thomasclavelia cocleata TaxID=69824 RepID=UPI00242E513F|nr:phosphoadenosine phosphosulfate reductase family protein [Thomasclavelia cocleata]
MSSDLEQKITSAMHRIEDLYYKTDGKCYLSFSGGKDSTIILAIIKMCEDILTIPPNSIPAVFCNTGIELGSTIEFIKWVKKNWYQNVQVIRPDKTFSWIVKNKGKPIKSKVKSEYLGRYQRKPSGTALDFLIDYKGKYQKTRIANKDMHLIHENFNIKITNLCCSYLKKKPFEKYQKDNQITGYITGIRNSEGGARELNNKNRIKSGGELCTATKGKSIVKMPIIDWTNENVDEFIDKYCIPLSKAYTKEGYERTGCFLCPYSMQIDKNLEKLFIYDPNRYKASMYWLKDVYIAQNVILNFDKNYEAERKKKWNNSYYKMRYEMLAKYRPDKADKFNNKQIDIYEYI